MKHLKLTDFHKDNWHLYVEKPDKEFSAERNYAIIDETIRDYEKMRFGVDSEVQKAAEDRADILASYGVYRFNKGTKKIEEYLGKEMMARIYGEQLMEKLRAMDTVKRLNREKGNTKFTDFYLR